MTKTAPSKKSYNPLSFKEGVASSPQVLRSVTLALVLTVFILGGLVWHTCVWYHRFEEAETDHIRTVELSREIIRHRQYFVKTARMAAVTGDLEWEERYRKYEDKHDKALSDVNEMWPIAEVLEGIAKTKEANRKLVAIENRVFELVRGGNAAAATVLLEGSEYAEQKKVYSDGIGAVIEYLHSYSLSELARHRRSALTTIISLAVIVLLVVFVGLIALFVFRSYFAERRRNELAVRLSEQCFRAIADYTYFWEVWISPGGKVLWTNPSVERVTGYSVEQIKSMADYPLPLVFEKDKARIGRAFRSALKGGSGQEVQFRLVRADGRVIWVDMSWQPIYDEKGHSQGHRASIREITARKMAEDSLRKSEQMLQLVLDSIPTRVFWKDRDSVFLGCNQVFAKDAGFESPDELIGKTDYDMGWAEQAEKYRKDDAKVIETGEPKLHYEEPQTAPDGRKIWLRTSKIPLRDLSGEIIGVLGTYEDITERKKAEHALAYRADLEQLVASISTDFINLGPDEIDSGIKNALGKITDFVCVDRGYIFLFSEDGSKITNTHEWCRDGVPPQKERLRSIGIDSVPWFMEKMRRFETVSVSRVSDLPAEAELEKQEWEFESIRSLLCVPMVCRRSLIGFVGFDAVLFEYEWTEETARLLQIVGEIFANAIDRKRAWDSLSASEKRYRTLIENIELGITLVDVNHTVLMANSTQGRFFRKDPSEFVGKKCYEEFEKRDAVCSHCPGKKAMQTGQAEEVETEGTRDDGSHFPVHIRAFPLTGSDGKSTGFIEVVEDITFRKEAEKALFDSEERFRDFFENAPIGFHMFGPDRLITAINDAELGMIGYRREEIVGKKTWGDLIMPGQREQFEKHWEDISGEGEVRDLEYTLLHRDGRSVDVILNASSRFDEEGRLINTRGSVLDVTARKRAEESLRLIIEGTSRATGEEFFQCLVKALASAFGYKYAFVGEVVLPMQKSVKTLAVCADGQFVPNFEYDLAGTPCEFVIGQIPCFFPEGVQKKFPNDNLLVELGVESYLGVLLFDSKGGALGLLSVMHDKVMEPLAHAEAIMTIFGSRAAAELEREATSRALVSGEKRFRSVVETATDAIVSADSAGEIVFWNSAAGEMFGYSASEILGKPVSTIIPGRYHNLHLKGLKRVVERGKTRLEGKVVELFGLRKDGREFPVSLSISNWGTEEGLFFTAIIRDITSRREAEQEIREKERRYRELIETMNEGLGLADADYNFTYVNNRFAEMLGYSPDEMVGRHITDFLDEKGKQLMSEQMARRRSGEAGNYDLEWVTKDGRKVYTIASPKCIFDSEGNFAGSLGVLTDITDRRIAEDARDKLNRELAAKNEELESILFVASHDLRSPLVNIQGFSSELRRNCTSILSAIENRDILDKLRGKVVSTLAKDIPEALEYILTSSEKMDSLISGLLRLSRFGASSLNIEPLDMNKMLGEIVSSLEYQSQKAGVEIEIEQVPACWGDASQINQVFSNLLDNALNYLDPSHPGVIKVYGRTEYGFSVYCVEDNGLGIASSHKDKIFEIFHRLEPDKGKGEGLGLTIVRRILNRHKGNIWLESEPGKGSRFFVSLPSQIDE